MRSASRERLGRKWVPAVLGIGAAVGLGLALIPTIGPFVPVALEWSAHIVLETVAVALLVALFAVYAKVYTDTKARFALGLLVVLGLLMLQSVVFLMVSLVFQPFGGRGFIFIADALWAIAFTVFLYLSLE